MLELIGLFSIIITSFFVLIKAADHLISTSSEIGRRAGISKFVIGLTLVALGTSLPEFFTALISLFSTSNPSAFIFGTVIGSNVSNILLVFGILLVFSVGFKVKMKNFDIYYLLFSTFILSMTTIYGKLGLYQGLIYLLLFLTYIYLNVKNGSKKEFEEEVSEVEDKSLRKKSLSLIVGVFLLSLVGLNLAAKGVVYGIDNLGRIFEIPIEFLTLTTVAFATSLPEIVITYASAKKKEFDLAIGNIIGSNISNILFIIGSIGIITNISLNPADYFSSLIVMSVATAIFTILLFKKNVNKNYGYGLFFIYFLYLFLAF